MISAVCVQAGDKIVIAHRAASGYLMEHNLPSVALAVGMGSDYIEQDLVMTRDDQVIVLHDITLDRVTNVAAIFPGRQRKDGKFYALDFTLAEIKQLQLKEPYPNSGDGEGRFPDPCVNLQLRVPTLYEELELIQGLAKTMRRDIGIYPEIKQPWFHRRGGKDISLAVLKILQEHGYTSKENKVFLQCFDFDELRRIHDELFPALQMDLKLVQLIDDNNGNETMILEGGEWVKCNYDWMSSNSGLRALSGFVAGIGMNKSMLVDEAGNLLHPTLVDDAHTLGMVVHPWTFRREKELLPPYAADFEGLLDFFYFKVGVDGVFTDYCGDVVSFLQKPARVPGTGNAGEPPVARSDAKGVPERQVVTPSSPQVPTEAPQPTVAPVVESAKKPTSISVKAIESTMLPELEPGAPGR